MCKLLCKGRISSNLIGKCSSEVNEALIRQLHRGDFMDGADNVVLIGGPGTGKSHIATALAAILQANTSMISPTPVVPRSPPAMWRISNNVGSKSPTPWILIHSSLAAGRARCLADWKLDGAKFLSGPYWLSTFKSDARNQLDLLLSG
jgi:hypothetical protein